MQRCFSPSQPGSASSAAQPASDHMRGSAVRPALQFRWAGNTLKVKVTYHARPATRNSSGDSVLPILHVFGDIAMLQLLCEFLCGGAQGSSLFGDAHGTSLALPNGQPRLPGMRYMLHLLASCQRLMMPHRLLMYKWGAQFQLDDQYEAEEEAKHASIFGSSPEPDDSAEDAYYARQQNGSDGQPEMSSAELEHQFATEPDNKEMSTRELFYRTSQIYTAYSDFDDWPRLHGV